ncbi:MAG: SDR family NAD(P)-dependent oxidoreductase [Cyanobacteria bacterium]|nr:SDR family NAD(P)-dependent oxidoreductase [Cyanobacteriota bacterium]
MSAEPSCPWSTWSGHALVVGGGGIGQALLVELADRAPGLQLWCSQRRPLAAAEASTAAAAPPAGETVSGGVGAVRQLSLDVSDDDSLQALRQRALAQLAPLRLVIYAAGVLQEGSMTPEKRLSQVNRHALERSFSVNAWGPLLVAQALEAALPRDQPALFASLSARVGSIGDNRLGGWYAYRAAKAAQNQLLSTLAIEWRRRLPQVCVTLLHPGTTATALSAPFRSAVAPPQLFSPERAASQLLDVLERQTPAESGRFLAWDGSEIPW